MKVLGLFQLFLPLPQRDDVTELRPPRREQSSSNAARDALLQSAPNVNMPAGGAMSLQDCIAEALQHNFDVQIQRYNPQISLYSLNADYGGYDPTFNFSGTHDYNDSGADVSKRPAHHRLGIQRGQFQFKLSTAPCRGG